MAESPTKSVSGTASEGNPPSDAAGGRLGWSRLWSRKWLLWGLAVWLAVHLTGYGIYRWRQAQPDEPPSGEVTLGAFEFLARDPDSAGILSARFVIHADLADPGDRQVRRRLASHRFRVQQAVEELLRGAFGADFVDPSLAELKRQLREAINGALGLQAVATVIITDLLLTRAPLDAPPATAADGPVHAGRLPVQGQALRTPSS